MTSCHYAIKKVKYWSQITNGRKEIAFSHNNCDVGTVGVTDPDEAKKQMGHAWGITVTRARSDILNWHRQGAHWGKTDITHVMRELQCNCLNTAACPNITSANAR